MKYTRTNIEQSKYFNNMISQEDFRTKTIDQILDIIKTQEKEKAKDYERTIDLIMENIELYLVRRRIIFNVKQVD